MIAATITTSTTTCCCSCVTSCSGGINRHLFRNDDRTKTTIVTSTVLPYTNYVVGGAVLRLYGTTDMRHMMDVVSVQNVISGD